MMNINDKNNDYHTVMLQRSLVSIGNNYRMKRAIQKARSNEDITVAYLGASITMLRNPVDDKGYATLSFQHFKDKFGKSNNIKYVNAGMNGTNSTIGIIQVDRDVLRFRPDIVYLEFAVNDSKDSLNREMFESLVLRLLCSETKPAVVLLFMSSESGYSCQGHMQVIGEHYQLPMISITDAIMPEIEAERMKWSDYSNDNIHPNDEGNRLAAELICNYYETVDGMAMDEEADIIQDKPFFGNSFVSMKMIDSGNAPIISLGDFKKAVTIKEFQNGWVHSCNTENRSLTAKITCKSLFAVYKENNDDCEGSAQIYLDGHLKVTMSGYRIFGWNNAVSIFVFKEDTAREHIIEVRMEPDDDRKEFTLLAFGYCI